MITKNTFKNADYELHYAIDFPENFDENKKYPVIFYLHGMGMVKQGLDYAIEHCPVKRERIPSDLPFILVIPSCDDLLWYENLQNVIRFIKYVEALDYVDETKAYVTGSSMGGYTSWTISVLHPELFAAAVICCGGGPYWVASQITMPVIAVHGDEDEVVPYTESERMVKSINAAGGDAKLVIKKGYDHNVWTDTYSDPETYRWLYSKSK